MRQNSKIILSHPSTFKWYSKGDPYNLSLLGKGCTFMGVDKTWVPLLDPSIFSVKMKKNNKFKWCTIRVQHTNVLSQFSFLRFSVQLERRCSPPRHAFPCSRLVFLRGIRNFLAITYSDNFRKTCHFQIAWTPAILFSAILVFPLTSTIEGHCSRPNT